MKSPQQCPSLCPELRCTQATRGPGVQAYCVLRIRRTCRYWEGAQRGVRPHQQRVEGGHSDELVAAEHPGRGASVGRREAACTLSGIPASLGVEVTVCRAVPGLQGCQKVKAVGKPAVRALVVDDRRGAAPGGQVEPPPPGTWSSPAARGQHPVQKKLLGSPPLAVVPLEECPAPR